MDMDSTLREVVRNRVEALRRLNWNSIECLPAQCREDIPSLGKVAVLQYHEITDAGDHRVVVQAARQRWFGIFRAGKGWNQTPPHGARKVAIHMTTRKSPLAHGPLLKPGVLQPIATETSATNE